MADEGLKGLIPFQGRPFLDYVVGSLLQAGLQQICLVVPPGCGPLAEYTRRIDRQTPLQVTSAVQEHPRGTADALSCAEQFVGDEPFLMLNCDTLYPLRAVRDMTRLSDPCCWVAAFDRDQLADNSNFGRDRIRSFAVLLLREDDTLKGLVEKPANTNRYVRQGKLWVSLNLFRFTPSIFAACRAISPHPKRGELELTDAVSLLAEREAPPFRVLFAGGGVVDLTSRTDVATAQKLLGGRSPGF
jgi:glucose-1-phosphate thymidylyltransferase